MSWCLFWLALVAATVTGCTTNTSPPETTATGVEPGVPATTTTLVAPTTTTEVDEFQQARLEMVETQIVARGVSDPIVLEALRTVPRHEFVPPELRSLAYEDHPLPIGFGQTISQPYIVAWMSELLDVDAGARVLEVGTGSGYQAAVLAAMNVDTYTVEIIPDLALSADALLEGLGYDVETLQSDGYFGWPEHAPFDAIIVTAAPDHVPQPLLNQLVDGGRMVIPVGPVGTFQTMWRFTVAESGEPIAENLGSVSFVPLTREGE